MPLKKEGTWWRSNSVKAARDGARVVQWKRKAPCKMFEDIKLFRCWKLYLLKINKPSRWKRAKMVAISDGELWDRRSGDERHEKKIPGRQGMSSFGHLAWCHRLLNYLQFSCELLQIPFHRQILYMDTRNK